MSPEPVLPTSRRDAFRIMVFGTGGPQTKSVAAWPLIAGVAVLIVVITGLYGLISLLFGGPWQWGGGSGIAIGTTLALIHVLLQPIRHRWPAILGGLAAGLILSVSAEHVLAVPRHVAASAGLLAGVAVFAAITYLPLRHVRHDGEADA